MPKPAAIPAKGPNHFEAPLLAGVFAAVLVAVGAAVFCVAVVAAGAFWLVTLLDCLPALPPPPKRAALESSGASTSKALAKMSPAITSERANVLIIDLKPELDIKASCRTRDEMKRIVANLTTS
jgi:hypothetical protein